MEEPTPDNPPSTEKPKLEAAPPKPKKDAPPKAGTGKPRGRPLALEKQITEFYGNIALGVGFINMEDGMAIMESAETAGKAWAELANKNASVKRTWETILTGSAWSGVIMVHAPLFYKLAQNHNLAPELVNPLRTESDNGDTPPPMG